MKKIRLILICTLAMCCLCSCKPSQKELYQTAVELMQDGKYQKAYDQFKELGDYEDASEKAAESYSDLIIEAMKAQKYDQALSLLDKSGDVDIKNKDDLIKQCKCAKILDLLNKREFDQAKTLIHEIDDQEAAAALEREYNYQQGVSYLENKKYTEAAKAFLSTLGYEGANDYLFQIAQKLNSQKKYQDALTICSKLGGSKKIKKLVKKIDMGLKYQRYEKGAEQGYTLLGDTVYYTPKQAEKLLKKEIYGKWVEFFSGETMQIDEFTRNGKQYGIYTMTRDSSNYTIYYYYMDEPDKIYIDLLHEMNVPGYETQMAIDSYQQDGYAYGEDYCYLRNSKDYIRDNCRLPGYDETDVTVGDEPDNESDSTVAAGNTSNGSSDDDPGDNNRMLSTVAQQYIGQVAEKSYRERAAGYEMKECTKAGKSVTGGYEVKFSVYFPKMHSTKFVTIQLLKGWKGNYEFVSGQVH